MSTHVNPTNNSPSKQKYSFSKEQRFKPIKPQSSSHNSELMLTTSLLKTEIGAVHS